MLLRVLTQRPSPTGPPLQPHLLRPLPGDIVQAGGAHPLRLLPSVPLDHLHPSQPDPARVPVGQHGDLGPDCGGGAAGDKARIGGGFEGFEGLKETTHHVKTPLSKTLWCHVHTPKHVQLCAAAETRDGPLLTVLTAEEMASLPLSSGFNWTD